MENIQRFYIWWNLIFQNFKSKYYESTIAWMTFKDRILRKRISSIHFIFLKLFLSFALHCHFLVHPNIISQSYKIIIHYVYSIQIHVFQIKLFIQCNFWGSWSVQALGGWIVWTWLSKGRSMPTCTRQQRHLHKIITATMVS